MLEIGSRDAFCVNRQPSRLCRASGCGERSWDITGGESAVFIHCSLSGAQGVPLVFSFFVRGWTVGSRRDLGKGSGLCREGGVNSGHV